MSHSTRNGVSVQMVIAPSVLPSCKETSGGSESGSDILPARIDAMFRLLMYAGTNCAPNSIKNVSIGTYLSTAFGKKIIPSLCPDLAARN